MLRTEAGVTFRSLTLMTRPFPTEFKAPLRNEICKREMGYVEE